MKTGPEFVARSVSTRASRRSVAAAVFLMLAGCAGGGGDEPDPRMPPPGESIVIPITVRNNWTPRTQVTVRLNSGGVTRILGSVNGGRERTFQVSDPTVAGRHTLTATGNSLSESIESQPFNLFATSTVTWTLVGNNLLVSERLGEEPPKVGDPER
jgi:hypothetical protein